MSKPRLLDLFCGAGGASMGYSQAGFDVVGVDIAPQPRYPFTFALGDALTFDLSGFDAIHASPPCQFYTQMLNWNHQHKEQYPNLIAVVRERLQATGKPYIIENVEQARSYMVNPLLLCGNMFGLRVYRHRLFESNLLLFAHTHIKHRASAARPAKIPAPGEFWCPVGKFGRQDDAQRAMGIDWMQTGVHDPKEIAQAIPPAYTAWLGAQLLEYLRREVCA